MKLSRVVIGLCLLPIIVLSYLAMGQSQTPSNPTGVKIGSIVSAAISTAFPAVSTILNAIWPKGKEGDKQTKANAQAKIQDDQSTKDRKAALASITKMGDELETVRIFLQASSDANEQVIAMQVLLQDKTAIDDNLQSQLVQLWTLASADIGQLKDDKVQARIDAMADDPFVQTSLTQIKAVNLGRLEVTKIQIDKKQLGTLRKSLDDLQPKLSGVGHLAGILLGDISVSLKKIPDSLTPSQGSTTPQYEADEASRAANDQQALQRLFAK